MSNFVQRQGKDLILDGKKFKFASFNTPNLHIIENPWQRIDPFEQMDTISSISQMGGQVVRLYTFSIPKIPEDISKHLIVSSGMFTPNVTWAFNEELLKDLDNVIAIASDYNIKIIIPFIDYWEWWGGITSFAALYGGTEPDFYTSSIIILTVIFHLLFASFSSHVFLCILFSFLRLFVGSKIACIIPNSAPTVIILKFFSS